MAKRILFNPLSGKFDFIDVTDTSALAPAVPLVVADGDEFVISANQQVSYGLMIDLEGTAMITNEGTGTLYYAT